MSRKIEVEEVIQNQAEYEVALKIGGNSYTVTVIVNNGDGSDATGEVTDYDTASGNEPSEAVAERLCDEACLQVEASYYLPLQKVAGS